MKTRNVLLLLIGFGFLLSCNKLTEKNIIGTWDLTAATINGLSYTPLPVTWVVVFNEGNTGTSTINGTTSNMAWSLDEGNQKITIPSWTGSSQIYEVLEKKGSTLRVKYVDTNNNTNEYTFVKR